MALIAGFCLRNNSSLARNKGGLNVPVLQDYQPYIKLGGIGIIIEGSRTS
jgi:hypothetical protein